MGIFSKNRASNDELMLQVKIRKRPRFKAGAELSAHVNRIDVEVNDAKECEADVLEVKFHIQTEARAKTK